MPRLLLARLGVSARNDEAREKYVIDYMNENASLRFFPKYLRISLVTVAHSKEGKFCG